MEEKERGRTEEGEKRRWKREGSEGEGKEIREKEGEKRKESRSERGKGDDKVKKKNVGVHEKGGESELCKAVGVWVMISVCVGVHTGMNNNGVHATAADCNHKLKTCP